MLRTILLVLAACIAVTGCTSMRETSPARTASEQLLVTTAADEAAAKLALPIPKGAGVFVDATNFEGVDGKYAIAAIREQFLKQGARLMPERGKADMVIEIRAAALSSDEDEFLIGIPDFAVPVPLAGPVTTPEIALFKRGEKRGVAKFIATAYKAETGDYVGSSEAQWGSSYRREWTVLFFFNWKRDNLLPDEERPSKFQMQAPKFD
ncbi:MAG: hypothetical protein K0Q70_1406 [Rhodospirillales bacterium]|jgi:hypothetical protein|nr:hypothetical protein [Rhodospirillales bacterium]